MKHIAEQFMFIYHFIRDGYAVCGDNTAMSGYHNDWSQVTCKNCLALRDQDLSKPLPQSPPPEATKESNKREPAYTDDDRITFGKWKGERLADIPASYLHWLWTQRPLNSIKLENYIFNNIEALKKEHPDGIWE